MFAIEWNKSPTNMILLGVKYSISSLSFCRSSLYKFAGTAIPAFLK
jgi:hypothetical protein